MKKRLEVKDLITIGIFTAIYSVVLFVVGTIGYIPILYVFLPLVIPITCGIPYLLFLTKANCFGMVSIMGILLGGVMLMTGNTFMPTITGAVFGLAADLVFMVGKYQSKKCTIIGYTVFSLWILGMLMPFWIMKDSYEKIMLSNMGVDYTKAIMELFDKVAWAFPIMCIIGSVIGAFLGFSVLKKHFKKAGIV